DDGFLQACRKIGLIGGGQSTAVFLDREAQRRFEAGERKVATFAPDHRPRQRRMFRLARSGGALDRRTAGIAEAQQLRALVESLARRVVDRRAEPAIAADAFDDLKLA